MPFAVRAALGSRCISRRRPGLLAFMTSFADLVDARWRSLAAPDDPQGRLRYDLMREHFERTHGRIVVAHWSSREAAGVAVCCRHLPSGRLQWSLQRSMGALAAQRPEFSPLLRHVAGEAARASGVLSGRAQRLAVANLFTRSRHVMAALEAS
jgi:hypothetical protein